MNLRRLLAQAASFFPSRLPIGMSEFETWSDSVISLLPKGFESVPSWQLKNVLATMIMGLPLRQDRASKRGFVKALRKTAANQVAGEVYRNTKEFQVNLEKLGKESAAATAKTPDAASGSETVQKT